MEAREGSHTGVSVGLARAGLSVGHRGAQEDNRPGRRGSARRKREAGAG